MIAPGPAFIAVINDRMVARTVKCKTQLGVPEGYIWQPATIGTMAGWVRPKGVIVENGND